jgi:thermitase
MKPHFIIQLRQPLEGFVPYWLDVAQNNVPARTNTFPELDNILREHNLNVRVTAEYAPASAMTWSPQEFLAGFNRIYRIILSDDREIPASVIAQIQVLPVVERVRMGRIAQTPIPTPALSMAYGQLTDAARKEIFLDEVHTYTQGHPSIKIAVLDTGVYLSHPELRHCLLPGKDFVNIIDGASEHLEKKLNEQQDEFGGDFRDEDDDPNDPIVGHGTHVAGIISGKGAQMPKGVVPKCKIIPVRVLAALKQGNRYVGAGLVDNINTGIKWAVDQGADVINMSLGIRHTEGGLPHEEVVNYARRKGVTIVAAAGNDGQEELYYPGALPHVIAVGATDENNGVAFFSTYGKQVSIVAPGTNIYSTSIDNDYAFSTGTSHASPFVAGAVAMLKSYALQHGRKISDNQIKFILKNTADKIDGSFKHKKAGYGKLNLIDAIKLLQYKLNMLN